MAVIRLIAKVNNKKYKNVCFMNRLTACYRLASQINYLNSSERAVLWRYVSTLPVSIKHVISIIVVVALIPAIAWYIGLTLVGWRVAGGSAIGISLTSGILISFYLYFSMLVMVISVGLSMKWMAKTYQASIGLAQSLMFSFINALPFLVLSICGLYPLFWLDLTLLLVAIMISVASLYEGMPIIMKIPKETAFLFSSAVVVTGMIAFIVLVVLFVVLLDLGLYPALLDLAA